MYLVPITFVDGTLGCLWKIPRRRCLASNSVVPRGSLQSLLAREHLIVPQEADHINIQENQLGRRNVREYRQARPDSVTLEGFTPQLYKPLNCIALWGWT